MLYLSTMFMFPYIALPGKILYIVMHVIKKIFQPIFSNLVTLFSVGNILY